MGAWIATGIVAIAAGLILLWHMRRPKPRKMAVSFARFIPALPAAQSNSSRLALSRPRDLLPLALMMLIAAGMMWIIFDGARERLANRTDHIGLRLVVDISHSMSVADGEATRADSARAVVEAARQTLLQADTPSLCAELVTVSDIPQSLQTLDLQSTFTAPLSPAPVGADAQGLLRAVQLPAQSCPLTHVLVVSDLPQPAQSASTEGPVMLWAQIGAPVANAGLTGATLEAGALGSGTGRLRITGRVSAAQVPESLILTGPSGARTLPVYPDPAQEGAFYATTPWGGAGRYTVALTGDSYTPDDRIAFTLAQADALALAWQLTTLPRPAALPAGGASSPLVAPLPAAPDPARVALYTYEGFGAAGGLIGPFISDPLLETLNLDALEMVLPAPIPQALPAGFTAILTNEQGAPIIARRAGATPALILPAPRPDLGEPARSLSLTLFFAGLADVAALPPAGIATTFGDDIPEAWRESHTGRALAEMPDLRLLTRAGSAAQSEPLWPWAVLAMLLALLGERALRLTRHLRRGEDLA